MNNPIIKPIWSDLMRDIKTATFWKNPLKHIWYRIQWNLRPEINWSGSKPLSVDVELSNGCNFRCTMCQQSTNWLKKEEELFMSWNTLKLVVDECKRLGVYSMKVNWRGEPTLDPECADKIAYIKQQGIHEVQMNSNASKLTPSFCDQLIESGLDRIIFSCDGLSKETYNTIRRGGNFDTFVSNVTMFRQRRNAKDVGRNWFNRRLPVIRINMAVMDQNRHEKPLFKDFFKDIADEMSFNEVYQPQSSNINKGQKRKSKRKGCPQIWQRLIVSVHGTVMPCCVDFREKLAQGTIQNESLSTIWNSRMSNLRSMHKIGLGRKVSGCTNCDNFALSEVDSTGKVVWK